VAHVTVNFAGVHLVGGDKKTTTVSVDGEVSLAELFRLLERQLDIKTLDESLEERYLALINGESTGPLRNSELPFPPGSTVSIIPLLAGGGI
jgi:hypothetical protein